MWQVARWGILLVSFVFAVVVYGVWKQLDREIEGGFISAFIRGAVISVFLAWVWGVTKKFGAKT